MATRQVLSSEQQAIVTVWQQVNASLSAYHKLIQHFGHAKHALSASVTDWQQLGIHQAHLNRHKQPDVSEQLIEQIQHALANGNYQLIFANQDNYPQSLKQLYDPPPLLFYRGNLARLHDAQIAIVGSRKPSIQAQKNTFDMAQYLAQAGYIITSGLAQGVDAQAHLGALAQPTDQQGRTIGVMGTGIDVCYPKQHHGLFERIVAEGGCLITELLPNTQPNKHTFPRRNRLVAGLSLATIVTEAKVQSGSLITARLAAEQGKQVFAIPSDIHNDNAQGCHHLIREGATLIYHPNQVIEDITHQTNLPAVFAYQASSNEPNDGLTAANQSNTATQPVAHPHPTTSHTLPSSTAKSLATSKTPPQPSTGTIPNSEITVPTHLQPLVLYLQWEGQDLDTLINKTQLDTPTLLGQLMELELLGIISQQGGRYRRV